MEYLIRTIDNFYEVEQNNIPKKLHIIWKTDGKRPDYLVKQLEDWAKILDSSWNIMFWNNYSLEKLKEESDDFGKQIFDIAERQLEMAAYADIIREYIVWKFGGYYLDADMEVYNTIEPLTHVDSDFIVCNDTDAYWPYLCNAFFAAEKGLPFLKHLLDVTIEKHKNPEFYNEWIIKRTGPIFIGHQMTLYKDFKQVIAKVPREYIFKNQSGDKLVVDARSCVEEVVETFEPRFVRHIFANTHVVCDNLERFEKQKPKEDYQKLIDKNIPIEFTKDIVDSYIDARNHEIGEFTYGKPHVTFYEGYKGHLKIGKFCSIAPDVEIFINGYHNTNCVSTYPFSIMCMRDIEYFKDIKFDEKSIPYNKDVIIGNDVYIGEGSKIMGGVTIGDGAVIASGSVVTNNVNPYEIVGGNPAAHIKFRFNQEQIEKLLKIAWWNWDLEKIRQNVVYITSEDIDGFIDKFYLGYLKSLNKNIEHLKPLNKSN